VAVADEEQKGPILIGRLVVVLSAWAVVALFIGLLIIPWAGFLTVFLPVGVAVSFATGSRIPGYKRFYKPIYDPIALAVSGFIRGEPAR